MPAESDKGDLTNRVLLQVHTNRVDLSLFYKIDPNCTMPGALVR